MIEIALSMIKRLGPFFDWQLLGSSLNDGDVLTQSQADIIVGVEPVLGAHLALDSGGLTCLELVHQVQVPISVVDRELQVINVSFLQRNFHFIERISSKLEHLAIFQTKLSFIIFAKNTFHLPLLIICRVPLRKVI